MKKRADTKMRYANIDGYKNYCVNEYVNKINSAFIYNLNIDLYKNTCHIPVVLIEPLLAALISYTPHVSHI